MTAPAQHGPLPRLLIGLTVVTGLVDAFSYLTLGHVFVANMTGNVVFFGFALAGVGEVSAFASLLAVVAFAAGAALGGRLAREPRPHRGYLLAAACSVQAVPMLASAIVVAVAGTGLTVTRMVLIALLAAAMGGQNAVVRRLGVPDLTTTVLTLTVTGLVADASPAPVRVRRVLAVLAMVLGAFIGGVLLQRRVDLAPHARGGPAPARFGSGVVIVPDQPALSEHVRPVGVAVGLQPAGAISSECPRPYTAAVSIQFTPDSTACRMAITEALSSCSLQLYAQPPPPMAQAPKPTRVMFIPVVPKGTAAKSMGLPSSHCELRPDR